MCLEKSYVVKKYEDLKVGNPYIIEQPDSKYTLVSECIGKMEKNGNIYTVFKDFKCIQGNVKPIDNWNLGEYFFDNYDIYEIDSKVYPEYFI